MSETVILAVCFQIEQLKKQPEKNSGLNGTRTHDLALSTELSSHMDSEFVIFPMIVIIYEYEYMKIIYVNCG